VLKEIDELVAGGRLSVVNGTTLRNLVARVIDSIR